MCAFTHVRTLPRWPMILHGLMFEGSDVIVNAPMTISISMSSIFFNTSTDSSSRRSLSLRLRIPFLIVGRRRGGAAIDLR